MDEERIRIGEQEMFRPEEKTEYHHLTAPVELKEHTWNQVQKKQRAVRQRMAGLTMAAGIALFLIGGNLLERPDSILSIHQKVVTKEAFSLEQGIMEEEQIVAHSDMRDRSYSMEIPLQIQTDDETTVRVSEGILQLVNQEGYIMKEGTEIESVQGGRLSWILDMEWEEAPVCTIVTRQKEYRYEVKMDAAQNYFIQQTK